MGRISGQFSPGRRIVARCRHQTHGAGSRETSHGGAEIGVRLIDASFATNLSPTGFPVRDRYLRCLNRGDREGTDTASAQRSAFLLAKTQPSSFPLTPIKEVFRRVLRISISCLVAYCRMSVYVGFSVPF